jgi:transglutaminase-like putative cysteine protease
MTTNVQSRPGDPGRKSRANPPAPKITLQQRLSQTWLRYLGPGDIYTLLIAVLLLLMPALALQASNWPVESSVLLPITVIAMLIGFLLARSQFSEFISLLVSLGYGGGLTLMLTGRTVPGGAYEALTRAAVWVNDAITGGINTDEIVFTIFVSILFWFLAYNAAWHVFRVDRVWRALLPPGLILIINAAFYNRPAELTPYLAGFLFAALLLIARSNLDAREWEWYNSGIRIPPSLRVRFLQVGGLMAAVALAIAWVIPSANLQQQLDDFQEFLRSEPITEMNELWSRLFAPLESDGPTSSDYYGGESLELSGAVRLGDQPVFNVSVSDDRRYYWRSRVFDTYEYGRWTPGADIRLTSPDAPFNVLNVPDKAREIVTQTFIITMRNARQIHTAPQPASVNLPTRTDLMYTAPEGDVNRAMNISTIRPTRALTRGDTYTATSAMSVATAEQLRNAGTSYPNWVISHPQYLRSSEAVITEAVRALAQQIVGEAEAVNNYDKAKAIERWLRLNIDYNETIPQPPGNIDPIEWFLFDIQQGYCNYYATAMIVMLRSQGIPARMAAGFAQGEWDAAQNAFVVRERDAHTWVEAYFPGYGWIEFEPTAAQAPLQREGDEELSPEEQQLQQPPTLTPTQTLTPTPLPPTMTPTSEDPTTPEATDENNPPQVPPTATITPTFTPSPTATPVILPTEPTPTQPEARDPLSLILSALGIGLLGLLFILLLVGVVMFIYWWWEWRGMRGMSPISRAYARLERYLGLLGIQFAPQNTPEERRRRVMRDIPGVERPVTAITRMYTTERYGSPERFASHAAQQSDSADRAWKEARGGILRRWLRRFQFWRRD